MHGAHVSKLQPGSKVPLHPVEEVPIVTPGELVPRSTRLKRAHIVTLEVKSLNRPNWLCLSTYAFNFQINNFKPINVILGSSDLVYYPIIPLSAEKSPKKKSTPTYGIVVEVHRNAIDESVPVVTVRSPVQVKYSCMDYHSNFKRCLLHV